MDLRQSLVNALVDSFRVKDDEELLEARDQNSLKEHSKNYDSILLYYTSYVEKTLRSKRTMKKAFFWLSFGVMIICVLSVIALIIFTLFSSQKTDFDAANYIVPCSTAIASFLTVFIIIPKIIAEYLFNNNEESVMQNIVASIQEYDKYVRTNLSQHLTNRDNANEATADSVDIQNQ